MNKAELWEARCRLVPALRNDGAVLRMSAAVLRAMLEEAWEAGRDHRATTDAVRHAWRTATGTPPPF